MVKANMKIVNEKNPKQNKKINQPKQEKEMNNFFANEVTIYLNHTCPRGFLLQ